MPVIGLMNSREHFKQTHYEVGELGEGGSGDVYLAINKKTADRLYTRLRRTDTATFYNGLRAHLVAVKFARAEGRPARVAQLAIRSLKEEIKILTGDNAAIHARITKAVSYHDRGSILWLAMPYFPGGDLNGFQKDFGDRISLCFVWHVGLQVAEALCFLIFGTAKPKNTDGRRAWSRISHGDIHAGNVFLTFNKTVDSLGNYPDMVLADFGAGHRFPTSRERVVEHDLAHARDITDLGMLVCEVLETFRCFQKCVDDKLLLGWIRTLCNNSLGDDTARLEEEGVEYLRGILSGFMDVADGERRRLYQPLPTDVAADIGNSKISDAELDMIFKRAKK